MPYKTRGQKQDRNISYNAKRIDKRNIFLDQEDKSKSIEKLI